MVEVALSSDVPLPRAVRRAIHFMHAHAPRPIGATELAAAGGVARRTLYDHFRHFTGLPPIAYLRRLRLEGARRELSRGGLASVNAVARRWGFSHMGRFAADYRRAFGETPSRTRRR